MPQTLNGVIKMTKRGGYVLREFERSFRRGPQEVMVPNRLVHAFKLVQGAAVTGSLRKVKKGLELAKLEKVCGITPEAFKNRVSYKELVAVDPHERFNLSVTGELSMRVVDIVAPIGKGSRALIVSPPKAGKTIMLEQIANSIHQDDPSTRIIVLLIDERPEEVTQFRRAVEAEVLASSNDQNVKEHVELAELTMAHIQAELESGHDVVVLVDSLTRMGRAFNLKGAGTGRTMSGGVEAGALEIPRRFFGMARNIENGGSVTIVATALIDTGSRMDQLIFQEFKGTGNTEIVLDRSLAELQIFPAINLSATGTRKEDKLHGVENGKRVAMIRRVLAEKKPKDAIRMLLSLMEKYPTNQELLNSIPIKE